MLTMLTKPRAATKSFALLLSASILAPTLLAGCGNGAHTDAPPPPRDARPNEMSRMNQGAAPAKQGMSTKQKMVLIGGAALLYYLYKKNKAKQQAPANVQYYLSKSTGRVYYRDPKTKQAIWMTPAPQDARPVQIPESEAADYRDYQGYNNQSSGRSLQDSNEFQLQ